MSQVYVGGKLHRKIFLLQKIDGQEEDNGDENADNDHGLTVTVAHAIINTTIIIIIINPLLFIIIIMIMVLG